jgi:hypothetical protein
MVLNPHEKAYLSALQALREKQYQQAALHFDKAAEFFANNQEFRLLRETTVLLLEVKRELGATDLTSNESLIAEEILIDGKETNLS